MAAWQPGPQRLRQTTDSEGGAKRPSSSATDNAPRPFASKFSSTQVPTEGVVVLGPLQFLRHQSGGDSPDDVCADHQGISARWMPGCGREQSHGGKQAQIAAGPNGQPEPRTFDQGGRGRP